MIFMPNELKIIRFHQKTGFFAYFRTGKTIYQN